MALSPKQIDAQAGDAIVFRNTDLVPHTATAMDALFFDSGTLTGGQEFRWKVDGAGSHEIVCNFHPTMRATLIIR